MTTPTLERGGQTARQNWTMGIGLVVLIGLFIVTVAVPLPSKAALWTLLLIQALAAGAVAEGLTGQMKISGTLFKWGVKAGGSLGFALAVLWAGLHFAPEPPPSTPGGGGGGVGNITAGDTKGNLDVERGDVQVSGDPKSIPAGGVGNTTVGNTGGDATIKTGKTVVRQ